MGPQRRRGAPGDLPRVSGVGTGTQGVDPEGTNRFRGPAVGIQSIIRLGSGFLPSVFDGISGSRSDPINFRLKFTIVWPRGVSATAEGWEVQQAATQYPEVRQFS